ncbi:MAG: Bug family tripartite tricarboxylate transporter substrate binding protein [Lautropia sp.]
MFPVKRILGLVVASVLSVGTVSADEAYPTRPITLMVPYAAGGGSDLLARIVAAGMSERLGQQIVVDNRPGASTGIAASHVARAKPDGYTLLLGNTATFIVNELLKVKTNYTPDQFSLLGMAANFPMVYVVSSSSPIKTMAELVSSIKSKPATENVTYASPGIGSPHHLGMEALKYRDSLNIMHVPYKGVSPAFPDLIAERVSTMFVDYAAASAFIKEGRLRPLAVGSQQPTSFLPGVPTMQSLGYTDFQITGWQGLAVPSGTPQPVLNKLVGALRETLADPKIQGQLRQTGLEPNFLDPAAFAAHIDRERKELGTLIKANKITIE